MDRRSFVQTGLSALLTYNCSFARAQAATTLHGCRMATKPGGALGVTLLEGDDGIPKDLQDLHSVLPALAELFGARPGMSYYDDGAGPNALAYPTAIFPDGPDGTVLMGINLARKELSRQHGFLTPMTIMAHEFAHIVQYKHGMSPEGPWQMEPHADFMAGWFLHWCHAQDRIHVKIDKTTIATEDMVEATIKALFELGDYAFNDSAHHGEPEFRAAMVRAGYELGSPDPKQAFDKGKKFSGLN